MPLLAVWGPTGVGKTTVLRELLAAHPEVGLIATYTSRPARDQVGGHQGGIDGPSGRDERTGGHSVWWPSLLQRRQPISLPRPKDRDRLFVVDWVHPPAVDVHTFGPCTASVVLTTSPVRTTWRLLRGGRAGRIREALSQSRQFRRDVHALAVPDPSLGWQLVSNGSRSPAQTAEALSAIGKAAGRAD